MACVFHFSVFLVLFVGGSGFFFGEEVAVAEMHPSDTLYLYKEDVVQVICSIKDSSDISNVYLIVTTSQPETKKLLNTTVLNSTHASALLEAKEEMLGIGTISCMREKISLTSINILVEDALQNVSSVSSILWYHNETNRNDVFEVSWSLGKEYIKKNMFLIVDVEWKANDRNTTGGSTCSSLSLTRCVLNGTLFKGQSILSFTISVKSNFWDKYLSNGEYIVSSHMKEYPQFLYQVSTWDYVKTGPPTNLKVDGISSNCLNISWSNPSYFVEHASRTHVLVSVKEDTSITDSFVEIFNSSLMYDSNTRLELCGLDANTLYTMQLRVKPLVGYWSKPTDLMLKTEESIPERGPPVTNTSFWTGECKEGKREIFLYWRSLPEKEANGDLTSFLVKFNSNSGRINGHQNHMNAQLECSQEYKVEIYSETAVGLTQHPSVLLIPRSEDTLEVPFPLDVKVQKLGETLKEGLVNINVTWNLEDLISLKDLSLVFYFCKGEFLSPKVCFGDIEYQVVAFERGFLELENISATADRFAYTLMNADQVAGMTWIECVYDSKQSPGKVEDVSAHPGETVGSILVTWKAQRCSSATMALVLLYQVEYCSQTQLSQCRTQEVRTGDASSVILEDLQPDESYKITVSAKSYSGYGPVSDPVESTPGKYDEESDKARNIVIILSILIVFVFGAIICCCVIGKIKSRKKKFDKIMSYQHFQVTSISKVADDRQSDSGVAVDATQGSGSYIATEPEGYEVVDISAGSATSATARSNGNLIFRSESHRSYDSNSVSSLPSSPSYFHVAWSEREAGGSCESSHHPSQASSSDCYIERSKLLKGDNTAVAPNTECYQVRAAVLPQTSSYMKVADIGKKGCSKNCSVVDEHPVIYPTSGSSDWLSENVDGREDGYKCNQSTQVFQDENSKHLTILPTNPNSSMHVPDLKAGDGKKDSLIFQGSALGGYAERDNSQVSANSVDSSNGYVSNPGAAERDNSQVSTNSVDSSNGYVSHPGSAERDNSQVSANSVDSSNGYVSHPGSAEKDNGKISANSVDSSNVYVSHPGSAERDNGKISTNSVDSSIGYVSHPGSAERDNGKISTNSVDSSNGYVSHPRSAERDNGKISANSVDSSNGYVSHPGSAERDNGKISANSVDSSNGYFSHPGSAERDNGKIFANSVDSSNGYVSHPGSAERDNSKISANSVDSSNGYVSHPGSAERDNGKISANSVDSSNGYVSHPGSAERDNGKISTNSVDSSNGYVSHPGSAERDNGKISANSVDSSNGYVSHPGSAERDNGKISANSVDSSNGYVSHPGSAERDNGKISANSVDSSNGYVSHPGSIERYNSQVSTNSVDSSNGYVSHPGSIERYNSQVSTNSVDSSNGYVSHPECTEGYNSQESTI